MKDSAADISIIEYDVRTIAEDSSEVVNHGPVNHHSSPDGRRCIQYYCCPIKLLEGFKN